MRKLAIGIIAAGTLMVTAPAMAQVVIEGPGVGVRVGDGWNRGHHYGWRSYARGCRTVTVREQLPSGRVIVRTRERC
jgi:hypothetical protein